MLIEKHYGLGRLEDQVDSYGKLKDNGLQNISFLKKHLNNPDYHRPKKAFPLSEVERLVGIHRSTIKDNEKTGKLIYPDSNVDLSRRQYTVADINLIREAFNKGFFDGKVKRPTELMPLTIAFSMFKGGVGKTTQATHLAAHCALRGLKVLLIDLDPQASATFVFGYIPSLDINNGETMFTPLLEDPSHILELIKPTHYDGLDIITSGLELQSVDIMLPNSGYNNIDKLGPPLLRLYQTLQFVQGYDLIILDCAPNHAATTMNALAAADGIILPVTPNMLSYGSSIQFIQTLQELSASLINYRETLQGKPDTHKVKGFLDRHINKLFRILITNDPGDIEAQDVTDAIRSLYGNYVLPRPMSKTIALARSSNDMSLIYDLKRQEVRGSKESYDRGIASMKAVNDDILTLISSLWSINNG